MESKSHMETEKILERIIDELMIEAKKDDDAYHFEISSGIKNSEGKSKNIVPYSVRIEYSSDYGTERLRIEYTVNFESYIEQHIKNKEDMTLRVPLKWLNILPESVMGGILGYTYLGENFMARRADLSGEKARMVDIHESIHTSDEYETRCLTQWIMSKEKSKYIK